MVSSLASKTMPAHANNYQDGRNGKKICKITPHHAVCVCSAERIAQIFQSPTRYASANYCIGNDGGIVCNVEEQNRAYTSGSAENDNQAITIEIANSSLGGDYPISNKAWNALVELCVDICTRYDFKLEYTGDKNGSLTEHRMFASTACPGEYIHSRLSKLAEEVNARLAPTISMEEIEPKSVIVIRNTSLWDLSFVDITKAKSVVKFTQDTIIQNVVAIAHHKCGANYYLTKYSYDNNINNGINVLDCQDYKQNTEQVAEQKEDTLTQILNILKKILSYIENLFK